MVQEKIENIIRRGRRNITKIPRSTQQEAVYSLQLLIAGDFLEQVRFELRLKVEYVYPLSGQAVRISIDRGIRICQHCAFQTLLSGLENKFKIKTKSGFTLK